MAAISPPPSPRRGVFAVPPPRDPRSDEPTLRSARPDHDHSVQSTNDDATECKLSAVSLGYYTDEFVLEFKGKGGIRKRSPIINRGYFARVTAFRTLYNTFFDAVAAAETPAQVVVLGAGYDTTFFQLQDRGVDMLRYVELDFPEVVARKAAFIRKSDKLKGCIGETTHFDADAIHSETYYLMPADLRNLDGVEAALATAGIDYTLPTLFVSECVLIYLEPEEGDSVIEWVSSKFESAVFITYEQITPDDGFGRIMVNTLKERGCPLLAIHAYPDGASQEARYTSRGWTTAVAVDMNTIFYERIDGDERRRVERIEFLDELEEWKLISQHYVIVTAVLDKGQTNMYDGVGV